MFLVQEIIITILHLSKSDLCGGVENNHSHSSHNFGGLSIDMTNYLLLPFRLLNIQFGGMGNLPLELSLQSERMCKVTDESKLLWQQQHQLRMRLSN